MKSALGKNLGTLLNRGTVDRPGDLASTPATATPQLKGPGVSALLRGQRPEPENEVSVSAAPRSTEPATTPSIPRWYYFAANLLLLQLALVLVWRKSGVMGWPQMIIPAALVLAACGLAIIGLKSGTATERTPPP